MTQRSRWGEAICFVGMLLIVGGRWASILAVLGAIVVVIGLVLLASEADWGNEG